PARATSATSEASAATLAASIPNEPSPAITSPLSLSRMRWYLGTILRAFGWWVCYCIPDLEPDEARHRDVLAQFGDSRLDQIADRGGVFLDEGLLVKADLFVVLGQPTFDDFVQDLFGLAFSQRAGAGDLALLLERRRGYVFLADELRIGRGHLHRQIVHQRLE